MIIFPGNSLVSPGETMVSDFPETDETIAIVYLSFSPDFVENSLNYFNTKLTKLMMIVLGEFLVNSFFIQQLTF